MKELLSKKKGLQKEEAILPTKECSTLSQNKVPPKKKKSRMFHIGKALCDLRASINLMPLLMMKKLDDIIVKPARMTLSLEDRSVKTLYGVIKDVLVQVDKFVFPINFVIMDMEEDSKCPLLLGSLSSLQKGQRSTWKQENYY